MQEIDAERRIQILRGQRPPTPPPPPASAKSDTDRQDKRHGDDSVRHRKRRRLAGEDDTDRDIRFAREDATLASARQNDLLITSGKPEGDDNAPIVDSTGHINLFSAEMSRNQRAEKNTEAEADARKKKREQEDQYTMRFSNAAGFKESVGRTPWYSSSARDVLAPDQVLDKDVWGNEDPMRKGREMARLNANDPLAAIKTGVRALKQVERERKKWQEERARELEELNRAERKDPNRRQGRRSRSRPQSRESVDSLEGFSLDAVHEKGTSRDNDKHRTRHRYRHHHSPRRRRGSRERDSERQLRDSHSHRRHPDGQDRSRHRLPA
jgi:hypothetical protein